MHYGTWDGEFSNSYLGTSKPGVAHGDLSTSCTDHSFNGKTIEEVLVYSDNDDDNRVRGIELWADDDNYWIGGDNDGDLRERTVEFCCGWSFYGFETDLNPVTGDIWNIEVGQIYLSGFVNDKQTLDNAPADIFRYTRDLNEAYLNVYEANQWIFVTEILESNTLAHLTPATPTDVYVLRQDEKDEKEAEIEEIEADGGSGTAYPDHKDESRTDNTGAWVGLVVGLAMLSVMIAGLIIKLVCAKRMQNMSSDRRTLVNQSSNRSLNQSNSMHSPGRRNPDDI